MKYLKSIIFTLSVFSIFINFANALPVCKGETRQLIWTSSNCQPNSFSGTNFGDNSCAFESSAGAGSKTISNIQSSCTVNFSCTGSPISSDTLTIKPVNECCSNGQPGGTFSGACQYCAASQVYSAAAQSCVAAVSALTASACVIPIGGSSCQTTVSWNTNGYGANVYNTQTGRSLNASIERVYDTDYDNSGVQNYSDNTVYSANGSAAYTVTPNNNSFTFAVNPTRTAIADVSCATGSAWNGSTCTASAVSGNITANNCTVAFGASSCSSNVSWTSSGYERVNLFQCTMPACNNQVVTNSAAGNYAVTLSGNSALSTHFDVNGTRYGSTVSEISRQASVNGVCAVGTSWSASDSKCYCPAGTYWSGSSCAGCPANNYCDGRSSAPTPCPAGYTSPAGSTAASSCVAPNAAASIGPVGVDGSIPFSCTYSSGYTINATPAGAPNMPKYGQAVNNVVNDSFIGAPGYTYVLTCNGINGNNINSAPLRIPALPLSIGANLTMSAGNVAGPASYSCSNSVSYSLNSAPAGATGMPMSGSSPLSGTFAAKAGYTYTLVCTNSVGLTTSDTASVTSLPVTHVIDGTRSCEIGFGQSSCNIPLSWRTTGLDPASVRFNYDNNPGSPISGLNGNTNILMSGIITARNAWIAGQTPAPTNQSISESVGIVSSCKVNTTWTGNSCYCPAGTYWSGSSCVGCPANSYCDGRSSAPTPCPAGYTSPAGSTAASSCVAPAPVSAMSYNSATNRISYSCTQSTGWSITSTPTTPPANSPNPSSGTNDNVNSSFTPASGYTYVLTCNGINGTNVPSAPISVPSAPASITATTLPYTAGADRNVISISGAYTCTVPSARYSVTRSNPAPYLVASGNLPPMSGSFTNAMPLTNTDQDIIYTVSCLRADGSEVNSSTVTVKVKAKIFVNITPNSAIPVGSSPTIKWASNGNNCDLRDKPASNLIISNVSKTGTGPYNYTATISTTSPQFRTELNNPGVYGYDIVCSDSNDSSRPIQSSPVTVTVYRATVAGIVDNGNGTANLKCSMDWTRATLKNTQTGAIIPGWPKTNTNNQNLNLTYTMGSNSSIMLTCENDYQSDSASLPRTDLGLNGSIKVDTNSPAISSTVNDPAAGNTDSTEELTITATSSTGYFSNINYEVIGAQVYTVEFADNINGALSTSNVPASLRLSSGTSTVNVNNFGPYTNGAKIRVTVKRNGVTKILNIILRTDIAPSAAIENITYSGSTSTINFRCENSARFEIVDTADNSIVASANIPANTSSYLGSYEYNMGTNLNKKLRLMCISSPGAISEKDINIVNPALAAATFQRLSIYPSEQVCGGGKVAISFEVANAKGKGCKLSAKEIKTGNVIATTTAIYKNAANVTVSTFDELMNADNTANIAKGTISGIAVTKSTRFTISCGGAPSAALPSSKSVDVKVTCQGQE